MKDAPLMYQLHRAHGKRGVAKCGAGLWCSCIDRVNISVDYSIYLIFLRLNMKTQALYRLVIRLYLVCMG